MKFLIVLIFLTLPILNINGQEMRKQERQRMHRVEQLERIKLIESLDLTEEQSLKFFARRNEHRKEIENIEKKIDEVMEEMHKLLNRNDVKESRLKKLNEEVLTNREKIETKRKQFISSLTDILSTEQISKLLLFERRFREEIRDLIIKRRNPKR